MPSLPIDFILNFQINSAKATHGITKMTSGVESLAKTAVQVNKNFTQWWNKELPSMFKNDTYMIENYRRSLQKTFDKELADQFGKSIGDVSKKFKAMYSDKNFKEFGKSFESLKDRIEALAPHIKMDAVGLGQMFNSLSEIRTLNVKDFEKLSTNFEKMGKTFENLKPKQQKAMTKLFEEFAKSDKTTDKLQTLNKELDKMIKYQEGIEELKGAFSDLFGFLPNGVDTLRQIARAAGAYTVFQDAAEAQQQMVTTLTQLGNISKNLKDGMGKAKASLMDFSYAVLDVGTDTQINMKDATEAMSALANQRITTNIDDMKELAVTSVRMGQAFGMSTDQATEFIGALYKIGGLSKSEVAGAADTLANIQDKLGLTAAEASGVANQVASMTRTMKVFGGRVKDIQAMTNGVAKLNVAFTKAGLSADEANQMLTSMLNPDDLEKNILLFQGLGMSAGDAIGMMTGETSKLANMDERMIQLAKNLKAQYGGNVFALKEMAAQYGMSLEQVQSLSKLTAEDMKTQGEKAKLEDQANKARASMMGELTKLWNQFNVAIQGFALPLLNILTSVLGVVSKVAQFISDILKGLRNWGVVGKVIAGIFGAGLLAVFLGMGKGLLGLLNPLKLVANGFNFIKDGVAGLSKKATEAIGKLLKLKKIDSQEGIAGKKGKPALSPEENLKKADKGGGFFDKVSKVKPQQLLAVGAAIFFIAAGIALIVASVALLASTMKGLNLEQINGLIAVMAIVMGGMIGIMIVFAITLSILGAAGAVAAPGIIAVGVAMLLMGVGIALIVASVALLIYVIANSANGIAAFGAVAAQILPFLVGLAAGILAIGMAMIVLGSYSVFALAGLGVLAGMTLVMALMIPVTTALGNAFSAMGLGIKNVAEFGAAAVQNLVALRDTMNSIGGGFADSFVAQINAMADAMSRLSGVSMIVSATMKIMGNMAPSASTSEPANANTESITSLIAESNSYLSAIMTNTDKIVKILSSNKTEPARPNTVASRPVKLQMAKEG